MMKSRRRLVCTSAVLLAACTSVPLYPPKPPAPAPKPPMTPPAPPAPPPGPAVAAGPLLPPPRMPRSLEDLRHQAAERLVAANPERTYMGKPPDILLGIPVLEIEVNADGSIKHIRVLREPQEAKECTLLAIEAIRRAAPFGDVRHLPRPWIFVETFLFDDAHRFKPRTLDEG